MTVIKVNDLLALCKERMKNHRISHPDIDSSDTGAIIAIIMYFIAKEPSICRTKLECYILLLDRICVHKRKHHLFSWQLNEKGRIRDFKNFIDYMTKERLIYLRENSKYYFEFVKDTSDNIVGNFSLMLSNIIYWLNSILNVCKTMNSREMLSLIIGTKKETNQSIACKNIHKAMDRNLKLYQQNKLAKEQESEEQLVKKLLGL